MNPKKEPAPKVGDIMYTFLDPNDQWGLELTDEPVVVVVMEEKDPTYVYTTIRCLTITGVLQLVQYLDIHRTKEEAYLWYEKFYGYQTLKNFRGQ